MGKLKGVEDKKCVGKHIFISLYIFFEKKENFYLNSFSYTSFCLHPMKKTEFKILKKDRKKKKEEELHFSWESSMPYSILYPKIDM